MRKSPRPEKLTVEGPVGPLESVLEMPGGDHPIAVALVCHPHPQHGGTMQNKVVHTLARAFLGTGIAALRFNFRGVGSSAGSFDEGNGEVQDVLAGSSASSSASRE